MKDYSFEEISKDLLANEKFQKINQESHHGITRMEHSLRVARNVYKVSKKLDLDYVSATRAAVLHDFFTNEEFGTNRGLIQGVVHPDIALYNAKGEFEINDKEANMIESHMFPLSVTLPRSKEAWVLTGVDKAVAIYEYSTNKFHPKRVYSTIGYASTFALVLLFNIITMGRN